VDFLFIHKARVRMYGIDTPESRTRDKDEKARGLMSKKFLVDMLGKGDVMIKTKKIKKESLVGYWVNFMLMIQILINL
jgi:endonuclease YncB( thermonuclease family)